jgi:hypothetical protein
MQNKINARPATALDAELADQHRQQLGWSRVEASNLTTIGLGPKRTPERRLFGTVGLPALLSVEADASAVLRRFRTISTHRIEDHISHRLQQYAWSVVHTANILHLDGGFEG